mgnify:CR=1 FL=1
MKIQLEDLTKSFPGRGRNSSRVTAVKDFNFEIPDGELIGLLGPSGCGKSTTLNMICGLEKPTSGKIFFGDKDVTALPPEKRGVGMVFQNYALYPHLTVRQNIIFPLQNLKGKDKLSRAEMEKRAMDAAALVQIQELMERKPGELSGGQQQRVAIARALVNRPKVLLLDEPLGALDLRLRKDMQIELKRIQQQMGITFVYVTHDQEEALTMSDTVVVMDKGRIQQIGTPEDIYNEPKNAFVADFIGESNILNGVMVRDNVVKMYGREFPCVDGGFAPNEPVDVVIRPEDIDIVPVEQGQLVGTVTSVTFKGMQYDIIVDFRGFKWLIQTTDHSPEGARIGVKIDPDGFHIMKKSEYSGQFGDYSSYSEEYEELADASLETDEEESGDEE